MMDEGVVPSGAEPLLAVIDRLGELSGHKLEAFLAANVPGLTTSDFRYLDGHELELWKPLIVLAMFFDSRNSSGSLASSIIRLAVDHVRQKNVGNGAESSVTVLGETLLEITRQPGWQDDYKSIRSIRDKMAERYEKEQKWLSNEWVGRALRRLGFLDKRRLGKRRETMVTRKAVDELTSRLGIMTDVTEKVTEPRPNQGKEPPEGHLHPSGLTSVRTDTSVTQSETAQPTLDTPEKRHGLSQPADKTATPTPKKRKPQALVGILPPGFPNGNMTETIRTGNRQEGKV
jgi:hypothetical protein